MTALVAFAGCDGGGGTSDDAAAAGGSTGGSTGGETTAEKFVSTGDVIMVGFINNGSNNVACYWKNGTKVELVSNSTTNSVAKAVCISNGDLYIAGYDNHIDGTSMEACYWKNNTKVSLPGANGASANSIKVVGTDVYVGGSYNLLPDNPKACYWKNGTKYDLDNDGSNGVNQTRVKDIDFKSDGSLYAVGTYDDGPSHRQASYWSGASLDLQHLSSTKGSTATGCFIDGTDIYVSGYNDESGDNYGCYWKNGTKIELDIGSEAYSVTTNDADIYVVGTFDVEYDGHVGDNKACYWKNDTKTDLTDGKEAYDIAIFNSDVYISGYTKADEYPCYWKNGTKVVLSNQVGRAFAVAVAPWVTVFEDDFNRADSTDLGIAWDKLSTATEATVKIESNKLYMAKNAGDDAGGDGGIAVYDTRITDSKIRITCKVETTSKLYDSDKTPNKPLILFNFKKDKSAGYACGVRNAQDGVNSDSTARLTSWGVADETQAMIETYEMSPNTTYYYELILDGKQATFTLKASDGTVIKTLTTTFEGTYPDSYCGLFGGGWSHDDTSSIPIYFDDFKIEAWR